MPKRPKVKEAQAVYRTRPIAEVFWLAFQEMTEDDRKAFFERLLADPDTREDVIDSIEIMERRGEPTRPLKEFEAELKRDGLL